MNKFPPLLLVAGLAGLLSSCATDSLRDHGKPSSATILPGNGVTIYSAGDIAQCRDLPASASGAAKTAALISAELARDPQAAVLTLGDHTYPVGLPAEFNNCYHPTWGQFKARTYPAPGNHEYYTKGAPGYFAYFGAAATPKGQSYYSFQLGGWHVISLNSYLEPDEHAAQLEWLKDDLARHPAKCTLAYWHHPVFSSGGHGNSHRMLAVWKLLEQAGADVILASHDHNYERFAPQDSNGMRDDAKGIRQFVVGTGGARLSPIFLRKVNSEVVDNSTHGVLKMVLKDGGYEWEFLPTTGGGFSDRGVALCR